MRKSFAAIALGLSLAMPLYFALAALGTRWGWWPWKTGLGVMIVTWGPRLLMAALGLAAIALVLSLARRPRRGVAMAAVALAIPAAGLGVLHEMRSRSADIPPIHDISTDPANPPLYSARVMALRDAQDSNPVVPPVTRLGDMEAYRTPRFADRADDTVAGLQTQSYPDIRPLVVEADRARLFAAFEAEARDRGWQIVTRDPGQGRFEAVARTFWFGFRDDVAIRVRPLDGGRLRVDGRSTSRVGLSDLGANAARLREFLAAVDARVSAG